MLLTSLQIGTPSEASLIADNESSSLSALPILHLNPLRSPTGKSELKLHYIAQDFIPIVHIATVNYVAASFRHYLPIHSYEKEKEYFLLI